MVAHGLLRQAQTHGDLVVSGPAGQVAEDLALPGVRSGKGSPPSVPLWKARIRRATDAPYTASPAATARTARTISPGSAPLTRYPRAPARRAANTDSSSALGGDVAFVTIGLIYLTVGSAAAVAPTPGGVGAVEAVLLAALTGVGMAAAPALAAVFLYRLVTFWLPIPDGGLAMRRLVARDLL